MVDTIKSASITTLDGTTQQPPANTQLTEGIGAPGRLINHSDYVAATAAGLQSTSSTYKLVRITTKAILKSGDLVTKVGGDTSTSLTVDLGAYYSDSTVDGTAYANQGTLISANCFVANVAFGQSSAAARIDALSNLDPSLRNSPLWAQVGLSTDPGGYIDIVLAPHTGASTGIAGNIGLDLRVVN